MSKGPRIPAPLGAAIAPSRRHFIEGVAGLSTGLWLGVSSAAGAAGAAPRATGRKLRYAIIGTGHRGSSMWGAEVRKSYSDLVEFVGLCDPNLQRAEAARSLIGVDCPVFSDFDSFCKQAKPDLLTVTTVDAHHADYIVQGLDRGLRVLTEKPMVTDERQCQSVLDAERRNHQRLIVGFNYRYSPRHERIKQILASGELGKVVNVSFDWYLDTHHGADYFRRWHRLRQNSGTLLVHKASHHFDLINWWLNAEPVEVSAKGSLAYYGKNGAFRSTHCRPCPNQGRCSFYFDVTRNERLMKLYVGPEAVDGYHRDGCLYKTDVDIYDNMSALVSYSNGVVMNYSLNACMPYEGYTIAFNCEKGTLSAHLGENLPGGDQMTITVTKSFSKEPPLVERLPNSADHGGGDQRLRDLVFRGVEMPPHLALPTSRAGALSCLTGIAARKSIEENRAIKIADLVRL